MGKLEGGRGAGAVQRHISQNQVHSLEGKFSEILDRGSRGSSSTEDGKYLMVYKWFLTPLQARSGCGESTN